MLYIDFETRSRVDIKHGVWRYAQDESTDILCLAYAFANNPVELITDMTKIPESIKEYIVSCGHIEAHNAMFEQAIWDCVLIEKYGWPKVDVKQWECSAKLCAMYSLPRDLSGAAKALKLSTLKDQEGKSVMLQLSKPRRDGSWYTPEEHPEKFETLYQYCKQDVEVERALATVLGEKGTCELEKKIQTLDQVINTRGVFFDSYAIQCAMSLAAEYTTTLVDEALEITGGIKPSQRAKIMEWTEEKGYTLSGYTKADLEQSLKVVEDEDIKRVLEIRQETGKTSTAKYAAMLLSLNKDDRIRDMLRYYGASTGRWSGKIVQPQNLPKGNIKDMDAAVDLIRKRDLDAIKKEYPSVSAFLSGAIRGMICAPKGKELFVADFAAIEARVLAWLAGCESALTQFRNKEELYINMAAMIYGMDPEKIDKKSNKRQLGKAAILGLGFGMGENKFYITCQDWGIPVGKDIARKAVNTYRHEYAEVKNYWYQMEDDAIKAVRSGKPVKSGKVIWFMNKDFLHCRLPSGRCLSYKEPRLDICEKPWGGEGYKITFMGIDSKTRQWCRKETYGGKLVENITQAVARDIMAEAMLNIEDAGYEIILTVHDELIAEVPKGKRDIREFEAIMAYPPQWAEDCPIEVEGWNGQRYRK